MTLGFRYKTDGGVADAGFGVDEIAITGLPTDGGETDPGWTYTGFSRTTGKVTQSYANYYLAEYRIYTGYDRGLKTGPYNFGFTSTKPNWVEHFPYQDGLLVWYYDTSFPDNNVGDNCARPLRWSGPPGRRPSEPAPSPGRQGVAAAHPVLRLDLRVAAHRPDHAAPERCGHEGALAAGPAGVRRHQVLVVAAARPPAATSPAGTAWMSRRRGPPSRSSARTGTR